MKSNLAMHVDWQECRYRVHVDHPIHLSIPLSTDPTAQPNAYAAPFYSTQPVTNGAFIGSIDEGSPVNFYNIHINPHGNGTHTECLGHISHSDQTIHTALRDIFLVAEVISIFPEKHDNGDRVISGSSLDDIVAYRSEALIVRTMPNHPDKKHMHYTGTNPPYFSDEAMKWIVGRDYRHLLTDLPSVDREQDDGRLTAHNIFWQTGTKTLKVSNTITEMIYVPNNVEDGLYLLNIQIATHDLDASPSRPVIFKLNEIT